MNEIKVKTIKEVDINECIYCGSEELKWEINIKLEVIFNCLSCKQEFKVRVSGVSSKKIEDGQ